MSLTNNQKLFCQKYVKLGMNGAQAYLSVYKSCKKESTARTNASRLLTNANIQNYIQILQEKSQDEAIMSTIERKKWLTKVINGETQERVVVEFNKDEDGNVKKIEQDVPTKIKIRLMAMDLLNKMDGEYTEKVNLDGNLTHQEQKNAIDDIVSQMKPLSEDDV